VKGSDLGGKPKHYHLYNPIQFVTFCCSVRNTFLKNSWNFQFEDTCVLREGMSFLKHFNKSDGVSDSLLNVMVDQSHQVARILFEKDKA